MRKKSHKNPLTRSSGRHQIKSPAFTNQRASTSKHVAGAREVATGRGKIGHKKSPRRRA